jgi:hypothetical protein
VGDAVAIAKRTGATIISNFRDSQLVQAQASTPTRSISAGIQTSVWLPKPYLFMYRFA